MRWFLFIYIGLTIFASLVQLIIGQTTGARATTLVAIALEIFALYSIYSLVGLPWAA